MKKLSYRLVDVFTDQPFGGNPLAVVLDGRGLSTETMQAIAKEFNLSETTFVLPPQDPAHHFQLRIFTPAVELPLAGHPTVGTAFVLAREQLIQLTEPETTIIFEEGVGPISVTLVHRENQLQSIQMRQPLPTIGGTFTKNIEISGMLSLEIDDLASSLPMEVVSCGVPFLFVPIKSLAAIQAIHFRRDIWERMLADLESPHIFTFTQETIQSTSTVHSRMFAPAMGISEDPATGAASGPLGCYLVLHGLANSTNQTEHFISEQGFEMGRPSLIQITIEHVEKNITGVYVGGQCHFMGQGSLELP